MDISVRQPHYITPDLEKSDLIVIIHPNHFLATIDKPKVKKTLWLINFSGFVTQNTSQYWMAEL